MIQIRNVPEELHARLKARAAAEGKSLSDYLLEILFEVGGAPSWRELSQIYKTLDPIETEVDAATLIREHRDL